MSKLAADGIPTAVSLRALLLPRQPSYRWRHQQVTTAELIEAYLANALLDAHRKDPELQKNVSGRKRWRTREELRITIITRIERTYHRRRRQARLGLSTSIEYGTIMNPVALAACPRYLVSTPMDGVWSLDRVWLCCPAIDGPGGVAARSRDTR